MGPALSYQREREARLNGGEYDLVTDTQCFKFVSGGDAARYRNETPPSANAIPCGQPYDPGYDFHVKGDAYIVLTLADDLDGWLDSDDAIQTASNLHKEYFMLRYWNDSSKAWEERASGLKTNTICFGARCKNEVKPNKEVHKIWLRL